MKSFAERLRFALDEFHISQHALARMTGLKQGEISHMVKGTRGARVQYSMVARISRALDIPIEWLGEGKGDPPTARPAPPDPYPRRAEAARIAREGGVHPSAIERVLAQPAQSDAAEWPTLRWIVAMQGAPTIPPPSPPPASSHMRARADTPPSTRRSSPNKK